MFKLKRIFALALMLILTTILLTACAFPEEARSLAVELPIELVALIGSLFATLFTKLAIWVLAQFNVDLSGPLAELAAIVSGIAVMVINQLLALVPQVYDTYLNWFLALLVILLGGQGFYHVATRKSRRELTDVADAGITIVP